MTFLELAAARYSVRAYDDRPVEQEKLDAVLEAARLAPTACNNQPQKIYVVKSAEKRAALAEVCSCTFGAPVVMAVAFDNDLDWKNPLTPGYHSGEVDASIVCTHMMLEGWEQGLGSCWVRFFDADTVKKALGLPEKVTVSALLPMGYAKEGAQPSPRHTMSREIADMVTEL